MVHHFGIHGNLSLLCLADKNKWNMKHSSLDTKTQHNTRGHYIGEKKFLHLFYKVEQTNSRTLSQTIYNNHDLKF